MPQRNYDSKYVKSALRVTSVNINKQDFYSLTRKNDIREIFKRLYINETKDFKWDWSRVTTNRVAASDLNRSIGGLKPHSDFNFIYNYPTKGPGEVLLYLLINDAILKDDKSGRVDMTVNGETYQVKSVQIGQEFITDFRTGSSVYVADLVNELQQLKQSLGIPSSAYDIPPNMIKEIKAKAETQFNAIETEYAKRAYESYFENLNIIFLNGSKKEVYDVKKVQQKDIFIYRFTMQAFAPKLKI